MTRVALLLLVAGCPRPQPQPCPGATIRSVTPTTGHLHMKHGALAVNRTYPDSSALLASGGGGSVDGNTAKLGFVVQFDENTPYGGFRVDLRLGDPRLDMGTYPTSARIQYRASCAEPCDIVCAAFDQPATLEVVEATGTTEPYPALVSANYYRRYIVRFVAKQVIGTHLTSGPRLPCTPVDVDFSTEFELRAADFTATPNRMCGR